MIVILANIIRYSGSYGKVKAMHGKLLTDEDYSELLSKNSVNDIAAYLKNNTSYKKDLLGISESDTHRGELEAILQDAKERQFVKLFLYEKGSNKKYFHIYIVRYEIELIKKMIRMLESGILMTFSNNANEYYRKYMTINTDKLARSQNIFQFIENLKGSPYYDVLSKFGGKDRFNVFDIEMTLDIYYFGFACKLADKHLKRGDRKIVTVSFGTETDVLNIMWIMRCKKYFNTPKEIIYSFLLPKSYRLRREHIVSLVEAKDTDEMLEILKKTPYYSLFEKSELFMEQYYSRYICRYMKKISRLEPFSIMTMLSYIHMKDIEISNIIKIIEGIRYKLNMSEIEKYLIKDGGDKDGS